MKNFTIQFLFLTLLLTGCASDPNDFTLSFSIESIDIYKLSIEINKDRSYLIQQQNLYLDKFANQERIETSQGTMTDEEYAKLKELIAGSRLFRMKDSYGFDKEPESMNPLSDFIYQLRYTQGRKTKYISLRPNSNDKFPAPFNQLIQFLAQYASNKQVPE